MCMNDPDPDTDVDVDEGALDGERGKVRGMGTDVVKIGMYTSLLLFITCYFWFGSSLQDCCYPVCKKKETLKPR